MGGTGVIDNFLGTFTQYIDSGLGFVQGDVRWLAGVLIAIDITLAGLFWAMAPDEDVLARLIKKTLYIGVFAFIIGNYNNLAQIIYNSFAGFVLVPFGLFGRTAFLAEKVLGNVVSSGIKILVLAVIIGIGSTIFSQFTTGFNNPPTISDALTLILAALSLLGLTIFGPGIANGLIAGGPQLGAGAAVGTGLAVAGIGAAGVGLAAGGVGAAGGLIAGTARRGAALPGC